MGALLIALGAVTRSGPIDQAGAHARHDAVLAATAENVSATTVASTPSTSTVTTPAGGTSTERGRWVTSWGAAPQGPNPGAPVARRGFRRRTLRQVVFLSTGGSQVRVQFSNVFGSRPLVIRQASVALQARGAGLVKGTVRQLRFYGRPSVTLRPGVQRLSDPVRLTVPALSRLVVSLYLPGPTGPATEHADSRLLSYEAAGSHALRQSGAGYRQKLRSWYFLTAVDTRAPSRYIGSLVTLGDSITAGVGSALGSDGSWPDDLARRLTSLAGPTLSVVNEGIGGNRVLNDSPCCGISALARFRPDVTGQMRVRTVILLEGINDLGFSQKRDSLSAPHTNVSAAEIIAGYKQIIGQAHRRGLRIIGATLTPFEGARYWTQAAERKREEINAWILHSGAFNGVIDFAQVLGEPGDPQRLNPGFDSGDHLHPNNAGYRAMADAIPLDVLFPR
jgi:lysophospholipase L1-like esterase